MKKKLEAELISIAHRILKLKNKSDLIQLHQETQKLYEKLSVLRFVEEHLGDVKPTIGQTEIEEKIEAAYDTADTAVENETVSEELKAEEIQPEATEEVKETETETEEPVAETEEEPEAEIVTEEPVAEEETLAEEPAVEQPETIAEVEAATEEEPTAEEEPIAEYDQPAETAWEEPAHEVEAETAEETKAEEPSFKPAFELSFDPKPTEHEVIKEDAKDQYKSANAQISFEDILGSSYVDPVFVKPEDLEREKETKPADNVIPISRNFGDAPVISINKDDRNFSLNDRVSKGSITIGLNDRVAFMKQLFNNSSEDYNRVLSQLMTFDTFDEAKNFIDTMVKPDYNDWEGKDEYSNRFMEIVEKKFS